MNQHSGLKGPGSAYLLQSGPLLSRRSLCFLCFSITLLLLAFAPLAALAQQAPPISGSVIDSATQEPLVGVTLQVKGTSTGTVSAADGTFTLDVPDDAVLVATYVGYNTKEVVVGGSSELTIALSAATHGLDQLVVVGYGSLKMKEVSSAITHVSADELLNVGANNPLMSLQGKVAGLSITNTGKGDPSSSPSVQLRGVSSRDAGLGPLYVINGIAGGNIDNINQNDILSIDVLKGGAASAIYGTRGSNGVIVITTKKGQAGAPRATYEGYIRFDLPAEELHVLPATDFLKHDRGVDYGHQTDWLDALTRDYGFSQKHTLQFSGGSDYSNYFVSLDYRNAEGIDLRASKKEYGARLNLNHRAKNNFYEVNLNVAPRWIEMNKADYGAFSQALTANPTMPVRDTVNPDRYFNIQTGFSGAFNPVEDLVTKMDGTKGKFLDLNASLQLNLLDNLNTKVTLGESLQDWFDFNFAPSTNTDIINNNGGRNKAGRNYNRYDLQTFEWIGNYTLDIHQHSLKVLAGYSYNYYNNSGLSGTNEEFPSDVLTYNNLGTGAWNLEEGKNGVGSYQNDAKLIAFFGRLNYSFNDKYYVSASLRHEGSSKFGISHKWGDFPAASVGWMISNEPFLQDVPWIDNLKLRADYGVTGNQDFGSYLSLRTYSGYGYYSYQGDYYQVWGPSQNANPQLHWEKAINFNIGTDFSLFSRLSGSINYYIRKNKDLLGNYNVPFPPNVQGTIYANVGTMRNSGLEVQLNAQVVAHKNFTYHVSFIGATNSNQFVSFSNKDYQGQDYLDVVGMPAPGSPGTAQRLQEGQRIGSFFLLKSAGVDSSGALLVYNRDGEVIRADQASADDKRVVGNGLPRFTASLGNDFTYKNWDLRIFLRGAFDYDLFNTMAFYLGTPATQSGANVLTSAYGNGKYAKLTNAATVSSLSDYFLEPGDFVKIDNVTLGYTYPADGKYIRSARIYVTARNLATFTGWKGGDPDFVNVNGLYPGINLDGNLNGSRSYYPSTTQILVGLQLNF